MRPLQNVYVETLILNVVVFGNGASGRSLGHKGGVLMMGLAPS